GTFTETSSVLNKNSGVINGGTFNGGVTNDSGRIDNGTFNGSVTNSSTIYAGSFSGAVTNSSQVSGGTFSGNILCTGNGKIYSGTFTETSTVTLEEGADVGGSYSTTFNGKVINSTTLSKNNITYNGEVENNGTISGGEFGTASSVSNKGTINNGTFSGTVTNESAGSITNGTFAETGSVINNGTIANGSFGGTVTNNGTISGGTLGSVINTENGTITNCSFGGNGTVENSGSISGGTYNGAVTNKSSGTVSGGTFSGTVTNSGSISGGTYNGAVTNQSSGTVSGGMYNADVTNSGELEGGEYNANVINNGKISLGTYNGAVTNQSSGTIEDGVFTSTSTVSNSGTINGGRFINTVTNESGVTINGGKFSNTPTNNGGIINYAVTVGNQNFFNIDDAFGYATSYGGTLTLFSDCTYSGTNNIQIKKDITIDLNGHSIDMGSHTIIFKDKNAVIKGEGTIISSITPVTVASGTDSFTVDKDDNGNYPVFTASNTSYNALDASDTDAVMKINGGTYNGICYLKGAEGSVIGGGEFNGFVRFWSYWTVNGGHFKGNVTDIISGITTSIECPDGAYVTFNDGVEVDNCITVGALPLNPNGVPQFVFNGGKFGGFNNSYNYRINQYLGENKNFYDVTNEELSIFDDSYTGDISYAFEVVDTYTVTFDMNGNGTDFIRYAVQNRAVTTPDAPDDSDDFVFGGWFTDSACTVPYDFSTPVTSDITLYAKWTKLHTVSFNFCGHGGSDYSIEVENGKPIDDLPAPTAEGFTFGGWFTDPTFNHERWYPQLTVKQPITLYAKWTEITIEAVQYKVTFDLNGKGSNYISIIEENKTVTKPADPTADGFTFGGWFADRECTIPYDFSTLITADTTVYAKWTENSAASVQYTVTFDLNGKGDNFCELAEENTAVTKPADPTAEGFTFGGWFADRECTIPYDFSTLITADTTVYAKWTENSAAFVQYTVTFDLNGKGDNFCELAEKNTAVTKPADPTAEGFTFGGWFSDRECTIPYDFSTLITADTTVYAKWTENSSSDVHTHTYGGYKYDNVKHWKECTGCGEIGEIGSHSFGAWETEVNYEFYKKMRRSCFCGYNEYDEELLYIPNRPDEEPEDISVGAGVSDAGNAKRTGKAAVSVIAAGIAAYILRKKKK
ncbi:MAG: InlB B-repeat-containing protein, partial [Oscillospiraceae bacterium]|nr:InlB B-repeat-containing protein [Oscillospiraceae bacterium]